MKQKIISHPKSIEKLKEILQQRSIKKVLLVTGKTSFETSGAKEKLDSCLEGFVVQRFSEFSPNPQWNELQPGIQLHQAFTPDIIIAIGGGSVMDMAKLLVAYGNEQTVEFSKAIIKPKTPLIAIPTTAGSGSEATHFAVVYVDGKKQSVAHENLQPEIAILDAELTTSNSAENTAASGLDALTQAIEAYWSVNATKESQEASAKAIKKITKNLVATVTGPTLSSRTQMLEGANLAGQAINVAKTTAAHALSYALTSKYGVLHGFAVVSTLGKLLEFNAKATPESTNDPRGHAYVVQTMQEVIELLECSTASQAKEYIDNLTKTLCPKLPENIDKEYLITQVNVERLGNNPRKVTSQDLFDLVEDL